MKDTLRNKYRLTEKEREFLDTYNGFDLGEDLLKEEDIEGPAHQLFRKYIDIHTKGVMGGLISLSEQQIQKRRQERQKAFFSRIPGIRRFVKGRE